MTVMRHRLTQAVRCLLLLALLLTTFGCAGSEQSVASSAQTAGAPAGGTSLPSLDDDDLYLEHDAVVQVIPDPLEPWNRFWFSFNDLAITYVLKPINTAYTTVVPDPLRTGINNFFHNLSFPTRFVNNLLQGKGTAAGAELVSFIINSTSGMGGILDLTDDFRKEYIPDNEDTGQTLGAWGMGEGLYIVWPLLGPSNVRDSIGLVADYFTNPLVYIDEIPWEVNFAITTLNVINSLDSLISTYEELKGIAIEPYAAVRDGYTQYRRAKIAK